MAGHASWLRRVLLRKWLDKYCGHWKNDLMHTPLIEKESDPEQGLYIWNNGDHYKGGFADGKKYGEGRKDFVADGSIMQGHWEYDEFRGYPFTPDLDYTGEYNMTRGSYMYGKSKGLAVKYGKMELNESTMVNGIPTACTVWHIE